MVLRRIGLSSTLIACALFAFPACETMYVDGSSGGGGYNRHPGPPAHAPAHGQRNKHHDDGPELVYDSGLGAYVVVGSTDIYYYEDSYYRYTNGGWEFGVNRSGPWQSAHTRRVPPGLHKKYRTGRYRAKEKRRGHGDGRRDEYEYDDDDDNRGRGRGRGRGRDH